MPTHWHPAGQVFYDSAEARAEAWRTGNLWWLLDKAQLKMYRQFYAATDDVVWDCARRLGKTFVLLVLFCEAGRKLQNGSLKYAAATAKAVRKMIRPSLRKILDTCPEELRPKPDWTAGEIVFPGTGTCWDIAGCDSGNYDALRGQEADRWAVDEAGFIAELTEVVDSVLDPQTWTTKGRGIIASTPPDSPGHPFQNYYLAAKATGNSARFTFWDNARLTDEEKQAIVAKSARRKRMSVAEYLKTTAWRREGEAEFVLEETRAVLPRFTEALSESLTCLEASTPLFADWYTVIDLGGSRDPTGIMVGYWDFVRRKSRIQRSKVLRRPTTEEIAQEVRALERLTFGESSELRGEHFRLMDDDQGVVRRDLAIKYNLVCNPPRKDDKDAGLMDLQDHLVRGEVEFSPDAREVVAQCQAAIWNKNHTEFERVEGFGHFDLLDCLLYMSRNVIPNKGRIPHLYGVDTANTITRRHEPEVDSSTESLRDAFGGY